MSERNTAMAWRESHQDVSRDMRRTIAHSISIIARGPKEKAPGECRGLGPSGVSLPDAEDRSARCITSR